MKGFIIIILGAIGISISIVGCTKYIAPTTVSGQECVRAAEQLERACINERIYEIRACDDRNYQRDQILFKQIDRQFQNGEISADIARSNSMQVEYYKEENCQTLISHCRNQYKSNFLACGGRIE
ncbi:MAG: hypothetical protein COB07_12755 [Sulfurovum sp.]|nr:MAG: hypothetical protein COB07_12755 [Sulfurovum sp.]